jgi:aspartate/methionine/tyrosine aminotransferase
MTPRLAPYLKGISPAISIEYNNLVYEMQAQGEDVVVLSLGEAFFEIPLYPFDDLTFPDLYHYSHSRGLPELRSQLAEYYRVEYGASVEPDCEILVTAGSKIAIHMALMSVLSPGDEALIHEPAWVSYTEQVKLCHASPVTVPHQQTVYDFPEYLTPKTRAIIVNHPNNPRGSVLSRAELEFLHGLARERGLFLISDEAYSEFLDDDAFESCIVLDPAKEHTIICNSLSKNYGMSGWRIGYVIARPDLIDEVLKINQHLVTCPATVLSLYVSKHFTDILEITRPQIRELLWTRRELVAYMDEIGLTRLPGDATFYFFVSIAPTALTSEAFCMRLLRERHVSVVPGIGYGASCDGFIRVSVGTEPIERVKGALRDIKMLIDETIPAEDGDVARIAVRQHG